MKKWLLIIGVIAILIVFVLVIGTGGLLKNSFNENDDVLKELELVKKAAEHKDWEQAELHFNNSYKAWETVKNRTQYSVERDFLEEIDSDIATLKGAIIAKDEKVVIITVERIKMTWKELGK